MIKWLKHTYETYGVPRTFYRVDGGFYIHPKNKKQAFLKVGKKRIGIFISNNMVPTDAEKYLIKVDDELRRAIETKQSEVE